MEPRASLPRVLRPVALVLAAVAGTGCAGSTPAPELLPAARLELRQAQSRSFEGASTRLVMKATLAALQDEGYAIGHADASLGLITATRQWQSGRVHKGLKVLKYATALTSYGASLLIPSGGNEFSSLEATVNVTEEPAGARARVSLVAKVQDEKGVVRSSTPVVDPLVYQALLGRLGKAVFLQQEGL